MEILFIDMFKKIKKKKKKKKKNAFLKYHDQVVLKMNIDAKLQGYKILNSKPFA